MKFDTVITYQDLLKIPEVPPKIRTFLNRISQDDLDFFKQCIQESLPLTQLPEELMKDNKTDQWRFVLSHLYDRSQIADWSFNCCIKLKENNQLPKDFVLKEYYRLILGAVYFNNIHQSNNIENLQGAKEGCLKFIKNESYSDSQIEECLKLIKERKSLIPSVQTHEKIYIINRVTYLEFLENKILTLIGEEELTSYFKDMITLLKDNNPAEEEVYITNELIQKTIFKRNIFIPGNEKRRLKTNTGVLRCYYRAFFTFYIARYDFIKRNLIYDLCEFNQEEIEFWEARAQRDRFKKFNSLSLYVHPVRNIQDIAERFNISERKFNELIDKVMSKFYQEQKIPTLEEIYQNFKRLINKERSEQTNSKLSRRKSRKLFSNDLFYSKIDELSQKLYLNQKQQFEFNNDEWKIFYCNNDNYHRQLIDFSRVTSPVLKLELKTVADIWYRKLDTQSTKVDHVIPKLIELAQILEKRFNIKSFYDITVEHLQLLYHLLEFEKGLKPGTIKRYNSYFRKVYQNLELINKTSYNPANLIHFNNIASYYKETELIPKRVVFEISEKGKNLSVQDQLLFKLLAQTGRRYGEIATLKTNCFVEDSENPEYIKIIYRITKTEQARIKKGLSPYSKCYISRELYEQISQFVTQTQDIRKNYNISTIFFSIHQGKVKPYSQEAFNERIRKLCKEFNICDEEGKIWYFHSHQLRKRVATDLIEAGAPVPSVQKQLNHLCPESTENYYISPNRKNLSELDREYLKSFNKPNEEEQEEIFKSRLNLTISVIETDLGKCSGVTCPNQSLCSECPNLCVTQSNSSKWKKLLVSQEKKIKELKQDKSISQDILREEIHRLEYYKAGLKELEDNV